MECTLPRIRRRVSLTLAALVAVWSVTALAVAGPLRLLASGAGVIDMSETGRFVLLHREGRVPHYVRLDRTTGETLGLRDMRGQTRMAPGGRVFFWNPDGQLDIYRQVGTNRPSLVFDAPNPQGWYFDYDGASADGSLVVGQALREEPRAAVAAVLDTNTGGLRFLAPLEGTSGDVSITPDGRYAAYVRFGSNACPRCGGVYVKNLATNQSRMVSVTAQGSPSRTGRHRGAKISADGQHVAFFSTATDLTPTVLSPIERIYVRALVRGTTTMVSSHPVPYSDLNIGGDGSRIVYVKPVVLAPGPGGAPAQAFAWDRTSRTAPALSAPASGEIPDGHTVTPHITTDGRLVAFTSYATNLLPGGIPEGSTYTRTLTAP